MPIMLPLASALVIRATLWGMSSLGLLSWALRAMIASMLKRDSEALAAGMVSSSSSEELTVAIIVTLEEDESTAGSCTIEGEDQDSLIRSAGRASAVCHVEANTPVTRCHVLESLPSCRLPTTCSTSFSSEDGSTGISLLERCSSLPPPHPEQQSPEAPTTLTSQGTAEEGVPETSAPAHTTATHQAFCKAILPQIPHPPAWLRWHQRKAARTLLPRQQGAPRKTLVLDLDQTLVECLHIGHVAMSPPSFVYTDSEGLRANVWLRPGLMAFLEAVSQDFEVVLFTAAAQRHADAVLSHLDPDGALVHHRLYGHHTVAAPQWAWVKDLSRLGRDLSQTLIIDDCSTAALFQPDNWVSIAPFSHLAQGWRDDSALPDILRFLQQCVLPAHDARQAVHEHYNKLACRPYIVDAPPGAAEGNPAQAGSDVTADPSLAHCVTSLASSAFSVSDSIPRVRTVRHCLSVAASHG